MSRKGADRKNALLETVDTYRREVAIKGTLWLVFDEIQAVENWEREIKTLHDCKQCRIILSGSSSYLPGSPVSTLLLGRYFSIPVYPLDFSEYLMFHGIVPPKDAATRAAQKYDITTRLRQYIHDGVFPTVVLQQDERTNETGLPQKRITTALCTGTSSGRTWSGTKFLGLAMLIERLSGVQSG